MSAGVVGLATSAVEAGLEWPGSRRQTTPSSNVAAVRALLQRRTVLVVDHYFL